MEEKILITGANGQLGSVLTKELQNKFGIDNIIASDLRKKDDSFGLFEVLDVTDAEALNSIILKYKITQIYHLAAILSANGEKNPMNTWGINMQTLFNVLEASIKHTIKKVFYPSSIAVYGEKAPKLNTSEEYVLEPSTVYGISKAAGENWANYYHKRYGLDVRSIRYPGVIGYQSLPGGGTTDYAVEIYHKAINNEPFDCFLEASTMLPMIYMDDVIRATIELMDAPSEKIKTRTSYNLASMSFTPEEIGNAIKKIYPNFKINYKPDFRQEIANSWPKSIDDSNARKDWGWKPKYDLESMTIDMVENLKTQNI